MKKTITVNLNGRVFTIDEDAYRLLDNYLNNLRIYFRKEEGASEIIADFEARIEELFSEKTRAGFEVITIEQVEEVIARVGKPGDFADSEDSEEEKKQTFFTEPKVVTKKFYRNMDDKMFGGVCSGIAAYFGWNVLAVRIIAIILIFATQLMIVPFYIIAWILFPGAYTAEQKLQMRGKPITVENIGKTVAADTGTETITQNRGCLSGFIDLFVGLAKVFLIGLGILIGLPLLFALVIIIIVLIATLFGVGGGLLGGMTGLLPSFLIMNHPVWSTTSFLFVLGIPIAALIYAVIAYFAKLKPINHSLRLAFIFIWILALILFLSSGFKINKDNWNMKNWKPCWNYTINFIRGNGNTSQKGQTLNGPVKYIMTGNFLAADLQIEQTQSNTAAIIISGDENLVNQVKYDLQDGRLTLSSLNPLRSENNLVIRVQTNDLRRIRSNIAGNIQINRAFTCDELDISLYGAANLHADSLYVQSLTVNSESIGSIQLFGKANKTRFEMQGVGSIDALEFPSDTVYAFIKGIGSIKCNPLDYLEEQVQGVGKIMYKDEPKVKNVTLEGIGKIGKE